MISSPAPSTMAANPAPVPACRTRVAHPWRASVASGQHKAYSGQRQPPESHRDRRVDLRHANRRGRPDVQPHRHPGIERPRLPHDRQHLPHARQRKGVGLYREPAVLAVRTGRSTVVP